MRRVESFPLSWVRRPSQERKCCRTATAQNETKTHPPSCLPYHTARPVPLFPCCIQLRAGALTECSSRHIRTCSATQATRFPAIPGAAFAVWCMRVDLYRVHLLGDASSTARSTPQRRSPSQKHERHTSPVSHTRLPNGNPPHEDNKFRNRVPHEHETPPLPSHSPSVLNKAHEHLMSTFISHESYARRRNLKRRRRKL